MSIEDGCLITCGACGVELPNEEHGEACECILRWPMHKRTAADESFSEMLRKIEQRDEA